MPLALGAVAVASAWFFWRDGAEDVPSPPDVPADVAPVEAVPDPVAARNALRREVPVAPPSREKAREAYAAAIAAGEESPGMAAFRADSLAFFEHNIEFAKEKAAREGISLDELRELTHLGLLAMRLRQWNEVERILGRPLPPELREQGDKLIFTSSNELKAAIREHVAAQDPIEARWETIRNTEERFLSEYLSITGLSEEQLDRLLGAPYAMPESSR